MKIVLISTYELGRQPFGLVSPAAWLRGRGHAVACFDLTRQELAAVAVRSAELIAIYLPMHTATRLACKLIPALREQNPGAHVCCYGLYAPMNAEYLRSLGVGTILGGEFEGGLVRLAERLEEKRGKIFPQGLKPGESQSSMSELKLRPPAAERIDGAEKPWGSEKPRGYEDSALRYRGGDTLKRTPTTLLPSQSEPMISMERLKFEVPDRAGLAPIAKYAHLIVPGDGYRLVGSTEASRGCKHLCRHCPIVPVYNGMFRIVDRDVVLADVRQQVAAGAQHISFGDPDFFNGMRHAMELVEAFHREFPVVTYDVTIKIEHLRKQERHLAQLRDTGCLFVMDLVIGGWLVDALIQRGWNPVRVRQVVLIGGTALGLGVLGAANANGAVSALFWISVALGGLSAASPVGWSIPSLIAPKESVGTVGGILNFCNQLSGIAAPIVTGYVVQATHSFFWAFAAAGIFLLIGIAGYIFLLGSMEPVPERA